MNVLLAILCGLREDDDDEDDGNPWLADINGVSEVIELLLRSKSAGCGKMLDGLLSNCVADGVAAVPGICGMYGWLLDEFPGADARRKAPVVSPAWLRRRSTRVPPALFVI
ncbi:hypothetical protein GGI11_006016 [Coemansia sp. RSA 2049]|nr:hypothetical protein GGI11_006016 [Coemansia sp. RSA 2049]KAJ2607513.1 hypothetical protein EV177_005476 [Coemansia sp. RSA 1804]